MTYELAKQLKEAGWKYSSWQEYEPTLSELKEGVWQEYHDFRLDYVREKKVWAACTCWGNGYDDDWQEGKTPEEAVANLWLAINTSKEAKGAD